MPFDKKQVVQMLREKGDEEKAKKAEQELPDKVDPDQHANLLQKFGINPQELISKL